MLLTFGMAAAVAGPPVAVGPAHVAVPIYRVEPTHPTLLVGARLPDGTEGLFRLTLGPEASWLAPEVGGCTDAHSPPGGVRCRWIDVGELRLPDVCFAAAPPGQPATVNGVPVLGSLSSDLWRRVAITIDLHAHRLHLYADGAGPPPRRSTPWMPLGSEGLLPIQILPMDAATRPRGAVVHLRTDAPALTLIEDPTGSPQGPAVMGVRVGGLHLNGPLTVVWQPNHGDAADVPPARGIVGVALLDGLRVSMDPQGGWFLVRRGRGLSATHDARSWALAHPPSNPEQHAALLVSTHQMEAARARLGDALTRVVQPAERATLTIALADLERRAGRPEHAAAVLGQLSPSLATPEASVHAIVTGLLAEGLEDAAQGWASALPPAASRGPSGWSAAAELAMADGDAEAAGTALAQGRLHTGDPGWAALDRARVALVRGDRDGAASVLRTAALLRPTEPALLATYALVVAGRDPALLEGDLRALAREMDPTTHADLALALAIAEKGRVGWASRPPPDPGGRLPSTGDTNAFSTAVQQWLGGDADAARLTAREGVRQDPGRSELRTLLVLLAEPAAPPYQGSTP